MLKQVQHDGVIADLPDHYPLARASSEEVDAWLSAHPPPYGDVKAAAPWLTTNEQVDCYLEGIREALVNPQLERALGELILSSLSQAREAR